MYANILAAVLLIPFGLNTLMRGSDGLNAGQHGAGEAAVMSISGAGMILTGVALLMGALVAGFLAMIALVAATVVWLRQRRRALGGFRPGMLIGRLTWIGSIVGLILLGWR